MQLNFLLHLNYLVSLCLNEIGPILSSNDDEIDQLKLSLTILKLIKVVD